MPNKIVAIGDSLTKGYGLENHLSWPFLLQSEFKLSTVNSGISGDTTSGMLSRFYYSVINHKPSHTIITGGTNDVLFNLEPNYIISNLMAMTRQAREHNIIAVIALPPKSNIISNESIFVSPSVFNKKLEDYRRCLLDFCIDDELLYLDFAKELELKHYQNDALHLNEDGNRLIAQQVYDFISNI